MSKRSMAPGYAKSGEKMDDIMGGARRLPIKAYVLPAVMAVVFASGLGACGKRGELEAPGPAVEAPALPDKADGAEGEDAE